MTVVVAFQGESGAYSEAAALSWSPDATTVACQDLEAVFATLAGGKADHAVVPVENSQVGTIDRTYDLLRRTDVFIVGEVVVRVDHCLVALPGTRLSDLSRVRSHPSALEQTERFLQDHDLEAVADHDTAGAAATVAREGNPKVGAVASRRSAALYGLHVLAERIQTIPENLTRFLVLGRSPRAGADAPSKTSIVFAVDHQAGALYRALGAFADRNVNLLHLVSRPSRGRPWEYVFHVDVAGHRDDVALREAIARLGEMTIFTKVLGSYPPAGEPVET